MTTCDVIIWGAGPYGLAAAHHLKQSKGLAVRIFGEIFYSLKEAQIVIEKWRTVYNALRLHSARGYRPPAPAACSPLVPPNPSSQQIADVDSLTGTGTRIRARQTLRWTVAFEPRVRFHGELVVWEKVGNLLECYHQSLDAKEFGVWSRGEFLTPLDKDVRSPSLRCMPEMPNAPSSIAPRLAGAGRSLIN